MKYSKYNIEFIDKTDVVVTNTLSASMIKFEKERYEELKNGNLSSFTNEQIESLVSTGVLYRSENQTDEVVANREEYFNDQPDDCFVITILTTTDCNARCFYCYENGIRKKHMTLETAKDICKYIQENRKNLPVHVKWFGGEPLYNSTVIDYICTWLRNNGIIYISSITTNGYLINEYEEKLIDLWNIKRAQITIDAVGEKYNRIKNYAYDIVDDPFEKVIEGIKLLLNKKVDVVVRVNFDPRKEDNAIEVVKYLHNMFGNVKGLQVYCAWIAGENLPKLDEYRSNQNPLLKVYSVLIECGYIKNLKDLGIHPKLLTCSVHYKNMAVIDVEGRLYKCQHAIVKGEECAYGSITSNAINGNNIDLWTTLKYPFEKCKECVCLPICQGGCRYRVLYGDERDVCTQLKYCLTDVLKLFYNKIYKNNY